MACKDRDGLQVDPPFGQGSDERPATGMGTGLGQARPSRSDESTSSIVSAIISPFKAVILSAVLFEGGISQGSSTELRTLKWCTSTTGISLFLTMADESHATNNQPLLRVGKKGKYGAIEKSKG